MPSHNLNQCWVIVNWALRNKLQWNFNLNTKLFIHENAPHAKWRPFCQSRERWVDLQARYTRVTCIPLQTSKIAGVCAIIPSVTDTYSHGSASGSMFPVKPLIHCSMASSSQGKVSRRYFGTSAPCAWARRNTFYASHYITWVRPRLMKKRVTFITPSFIGLELAHVYVSFEAI